LFRGTTAHAAGWLQRLGLAVKAVDCPAIDGIVEWARQLGRSDASALLQKTLDEERIADRKLTTLAKGRVNLRAAS